MRKKYIGTVSDQDISDSRFDISDQSGSALAENISILLNKTRITMENMLLWGRNRYKRSDVREVV